MQSTAIIDHQMDEAIRAEWPAWRIFWTMTEHDIHHGAEIGALRDLLRVTGGVAPATAT